jgi:hypothetical protein
VGENKPIGVGGMSPPSAGFSQSPSASVVAPPANREMQKRLQHFLETFCMTYSSKDLDRFIGFFEVDAMEQHQPFRNRVPQIKETFRNSKRIDFTIQILSFNCQPEQGRVRLDGVFKARLSSQDNHPVSSSGTVFMDLAEHAKGFRIKNLEYYPN